MCLLSIAWNVSTEYPLVFAGNRDEAYDRPSRSAHWWDDADDVLGGRDLKAGGSWLAIRRDGRFAVVTNFRGGRASNAAARSRGLIVRDFVTATSWSIDKFTHELAKTKANYNGFSLLYGDSKNLHYFSNLGGPVGRTAPGIHGLSNHHLDTPWPKVSRLNRGMKQWLESGTEVAQLFALLADRNPANDDELPDTGVPRDVEKMLSAPFIVGPMYGTRASTIFIFNRKREVTFTERNFDKRGVLTKTRTFKFKLE